jgi:replicative DNA helicase Mcm
VKSVERAWPLLSRRFGSRWSRSYRPESGQFDADVVETGQSKRQRDRRKRVFAVIEDQHGATVEAITDIIDMNETPGEHDVESLKQRGQAYEVDDGLQKSEFGLRGLFRRNSRQARQRWH